MDAVKFLKEAERRSLYNPEYYSEYITLRNNDWSALVAQVEQWSKEHPIKTRQSEFLKVFPNAFVKDDGVLSALPCNVDRAVKRACTKQTCRDCRRKYWLQEAE